MALFRKFFYRKPPDGLLEISEKIYVFDCCFSTDVLEEVEYKVYIGGIVGQLHEQFPDASFVVFNFREGENQSQIGSILSEYDMTVMDYPRQYEGCPLLTMEMIHHFLKSCESWLSLGAHNVLLMHCERGGWPVLAFMLAALLTYRKQYSGEQKTLDMIYKQAPYELLQLMSPLNPLPSQLRYLQYLSRRNVGSEWPPLDRALTLDCIILRVIPNLDGGGGCRPIFRIYGQDPFMAADRTPKVLFSTPKRSKLVRHYKQADCELVKIDIHCLIQGDVVLECIRLEDDLEREEMMFRVAFNTAFIRSNILMLNRDEIDILWNCKDQFPKDFRAEVLFSEMDDAASLFSIDLPGIEEKEGLPMEAFARVQEIFSNVDWLAPKSDAAMKVLHHIKASKIRKQKLETGSKSTQTGRLLLERFHEKLKVKSRLEVSESDITNPISMAEVEQPVPSFKPSLDESSAKKKIEPQEQQVASQRPAQSKIIVPQNPQTSLSPSVSYSLQGSPVPISRYQSAPSALGITALLHDHAATNSEEATYLDTTSPPFSTSSVSPVFKTVSSASSLTTGMTPGSVDKVVQDNNASIPLPLPRSPPSLSLQLSTKAPTTTSRISATTPPPPPPPQLTSKVTHSLLTQRPQTKTSRTQTSPVPSPPPPSPSLSITPSSSPTKSSLSIPPPLPPLPPPSGASPSPNVNRTISSAPPPPPPPSCLRKLSSFSSNNTISVPAPPPPLPVITSTDTCRDSSSLPTKTAFTSVPPPPPPPLRAGPAPGSATTPSAPPPPPPTLSQKDFLSKNSANVPSVPPPPAPLSNELSKAGGASAHSQSGGNNGNVPPIPGPPSATPFSSKGRGLPRTSLKNQTQPRKANLKPYHWLKLTRAMQGSLWAETQKPDEASKAPEFDMSELESLFSAALPNSDHQSPGGKSNRRASGSKPEKVQLIDLRRAYNCEIMLTKVKIPLPDLVSSVLTLDDSALDIDQVDNLIKFCPTKEEMELLKNYTGDKENLGKCEQFFLELMKVPRIESKLRVFSFKIQFCSQVLDLRKSLNIVNSASEEVRSSVKLKRVMQTILSLGNALNHGTARGSAIGFRLDSLLKLADTRARNNKMTLMHYLCKVVAEKLPELLDFPKDLGCVDSSTKIQLKYLAEEMQAISKGLEKVVQELSASENDGPVSEIFCKTLKEFLGFAEDEVKSLTSLYSTVGRNADALALYFGEDPARCPFEQVVSTLLNFVRMFVQAHQENCKQIEFEKKKKAQQEAENEKLTISTPGKQATRLIKNPVKSSHVK